MNKIRNTWIITFTIIIALMILMFCKVISAASWMLGSIAILFIACFVLSHFNEQEVARRDNLKGGGKAEPKEEKKEKEAQSLFTGDESYEDDPYGTSLRK